MVTSVHVTKVSMGKTAKQKLMNVVQIHVAMEERVRSVH